MTTRTFSSSPSNSNDTNFRAWGKGLSDSLVALGWVQTSDTGQVNWITVTAPTLTNTAQGYEVWRMNDTLQATVPVFIKIEYGSGASAGVPSLWLTIGTGSNGTGSITGILLDRTQITSSATTATAYTCYISATTARLMAFMWGNGSLSYSLAFSIERTHDASGADDSAGLMVLWTSTSSKNSRYLPFTGIIPPAFAAWNVTVPPSGGGAQSPDINVYPVRFWTPGESYPAFGAVAYVSTDFTALSQIAVVSYDNVSRTYLCAATNSPAVAYGGTGHVAWRFD